MTQLSPAQLQIVRYPLSNNILITAAPGSGKTSVINSRIVYLIEQQLAKPEQIVAVTFTKEAADNLKSRLESRLPGYTSEMWIGTLHAICLDLVKAYAHELGLSSNVRCFDATQQEEALFIAALREGYRISEKKIYELKQEISRFKCQQLLTYRLSSRQQELGQTPELFDAYQNYLREENAIDFDDQIIYACELLKHNVICRETVPAQRRFVFVDEFHDLSPEQFTFLTLLMPNSLPEHQMMIVADPNQSIYSWRGANAKKLLSDYERYYRPKRFSLQENFRSVSNIVEAAQKFMSSVGISISMLPTQHQGTFPIFINSKQDPHDEADWIVKKIQFICKSRQFRPSDIAILYRIHVRGDPLEMRLLQAGFAIQRSHAHNFFEKEDVQASLRYLSLMQSFQDDQFQASMYWPRVLVDELTMAYLQRLAAQHGIGLSQLARQIAKGQHRVSPLTRAAIRDFIALFDTELKAFVDQPIGTIVPKLLVTLKRYRCPIPPSHRAALQEALRSLYRYLAPHCQQLIQALQQQQKIVLIATPRLESQLSAAILQYTIQHYFGRRVQILGFNEQLEADSFSIGLGCEPFSQGQKCVLHNYTTRYGTMRYSTIVQAWCLSQLVLMSAEILRNEPYLLFDLETTSNQINKAEIVEMAAIKWKQGKELSSYHALVRPKGPISPKAQEVHGISEAMVRDQAPIEEQLPDYLACLGNHTLVGHNVASFDLPIIRRVATEQELAAPTGPLIDTLPMARRLLPHQSHSLQALAEYFGFQETQTHRALDDVRMNGRVFERLLDRLDEEKRLDVASELLPCVAFCLLADERKLQDYEEWLVQAGARAYTQTLGSSLLQTSLKMNVQPSKLAEILSKLETYKVDDQLEQRRWDLLEQAWEQKLASYSTNFSDQSLAEFLEYVRQAAALDLGQEDTERITLATFHAAKGKEWPLVFIVGAEEGTTPSYKSSQKPELLEEERRAFFVAMTRAKQQLYISYAKERNHYKQRPSRFLKDIPAAFTHHR